MFFFFKQKTAYEMSIGDWSSDVCSSDLGYVWEIIGVLAKRQTTVFGENEEDNAVFVPFRTGVQVAPGRRYLLIILRAKSGQLREAVNQVEEILRSRRNVKFSEPNNFDVKTADAF